jgi:hypothetical protein
LQKSNPIKREKNAKKIKKSGKIFCRNKKTLYICTPKTGMNDKRLPKGSYKKPE